MKKIYSIFILTLLTLSAAAQKNAKAPEAVDNNYDRASISVLLVNHQDKYDNQISGYFSSIAWGDKFDHNAIRTTSITTSQPRNYEYTIAAARQAAIAAEIESASLGKEIVSFIYARSADGMMSDQIIRQRGRYNATDQDLISAQATKIGEEGLSDQGFKLINNSYVLCIDYANVSVTTIDGRTSYSARPEAHLYKVTYDEVLQAQLFDTWIYQDDTPEVKAQKQNSFAQLSFALLPVTKVTVAVSSTDDSGAINALVADGYKQIIYELERKVDQLQVRTPVVAVRPIRAKIGMKEGVKKMSRYYGYKFKLHKDGKTIIPVKTGVVRASKIADNRHDTDGKSETSEFFQIAGRTVTEGQLLKQKNDIGLGLAVGYQFMGFPGAHISVDKLLSINTKGIATYLLIDASIMPYLPKTMAEQQGVSMPLAPDALLGTNISLGFGVGFHFARIFEVQPQINIGVDMLTQATDYYLSQISSNTSAEAAYADKIAYTGQIGAKLFCNIAYPLQVFVGVNYSFKFAEGALYQFYAQEVLKPLGQNRGGFGVNVGLKFIF